MFERYHEIGVLEHNYNRNEYYVELRARIKCFFITFRYHPYAQQPQCCTEFCFRRTTVADILWFVRKRVDRIFGRRIHVVQYVWAAGWRVRLTNSSTWIRVTTIRFDPEGMEVTGRGQVRVFFSKTRALQAYFETRTELGGIRRTRVVCASAGRGKVDAAFKWRFVNLNRATVRLCVTYCRWSAPRRTAFERW